MYRLEQGPAGPKYIARKTFMLEIAIHLCVCLVEAVQSELHMSCQYHVRHEANQG